MPKVARLYALSLVLALSVEADAQQLGVRGYRTSNEQKILREFVDLLAIPNVASDSAGIARNAAHIVAMMEKRGLAPRLLFGTNKAAPPLIYGEWLVPGATRTIVYYAHYDGQPTDPAKWSGSLPWTPVIRTRALESGLKIHRG